MKKKKEEGARKTDENAAAEASENQAPAAKKKSNVPTIILVIVFVIGVGVLLYPTVSDWWNSFHSSQAIANYAERVAALDKDEYDRILSSAAEYNRLLATKENQYSMPEEELKRYQSELNVDGNNIMGYIEIEKIGVSLPIYHGTEDSVLQIAVGHLNWTSLPIGGESTHAVLSGHRGLPSAKLFTNLDKMEVGDTFVIRILDEIYTYKVDQISIVLPQDTENLRVVEGKDYVTLVTCTPYGINTHRLLVRGTRTENAKGALDIRITNDATRIEPLIIATCIMVPILIILFIVVMVNDKKRSKRAKAAMEAKLSIESPESEDNNK